ncbi:UNVERIFIED_CONTAM: hypothetical protein HDU68_007670 [Siphonaria sp. JEL0065]|nr:hypothetical protein HDU68_007670 [Siphonaria sp. JEL0065]
MVIFIPDSSTCVISEGETDVVLVVVVSLRSSWMVVDDRDKDACVTREDPMGELDILVRKEIEYSKMNDREKKQLVAEVNILRELRHPNIVRYYERFVDRERSRIFIIMEWCEGGELPVE